MAFIGGVLIINALSALWMVVYFSGWYDKDAEKMFAIFMLLANVLVALECFGYIVKVG